MGPYRCSLRHRAKWMRKNPTYAERILWGKLRKRRILNCKFRRQHILSPYIVDFYCFPLKLVVEVDGGVHFEHGPAHDDELRDTRLQEVHGVHILRFSNSEVCNHLDDVLNAIKSHLQQALDAE